MPDSKKGDVFASPGGVDDLWSMMGMKKFSIMDNGKEDEAKPDLGKALLDFPIAVEMVCETAGDGQRVCLSLSIKAK